LGNLQLPPEAEMVFGSPESCPCPTTGSGRDRVCTSVNCMAIQFNRQVSCDEFDGLAVRPRPMLSFATPARMSALQRLLSVAASP
jgi:hypothetical protein